MTKLPNPNYEKVRKEDLLRFKKIQLQPLYCLVLVRGKLQFFPLLDIGIRSRVTKPAKWGILK